MTPSALSGLDAALRVLREVQRLPEEYAAMRDADLVAVTGVVAEISRLAGAHGALAAGQISHRSRPELGLQGLAQVRGARTVEELLTTTMHVSGRDAAAVVRVGRLSREGGPFEPVTSGLIDGSVSVQAADAIRSGLGSASGVDEGVFADAVRGLCDAAELLDPDRLRKRARELRDELDEAGIADRENALRARRSLRRIDLRDGMKRIVWDYDPESAGVIDEVYDRATSPRRGGPRFVDADQLERAAAIERDLRTTDQIASDTFTELLRQSASVNPAVLVGKGTPAVRVIVAVESLEAGHGHGVIEGSGESLSSSTVDRLACANGTRRVLVDSLGQILDLGREQRLYSANQRLALAVRDGGCLWPGCDRPPSWTEAHHIDHWARDGGRTDLDRGVLLCRHHHLRLHNEGWQIARRAGRYLLEPPAGSALEGGVLETKSRAMREHLAARSTA
ncbi:HNH endonuclease signature motif containing protein [soil metagenome]